MDLKYCLINYGVFKREQFTFYRSWYETISELPPEEQLSVYEAIARFSLYGEIPKGLSMMGNLVLTSFAHTLTKARENSKKTLKKPLSISDCNTTEYKDISKPTQNQTETKPKQDKDKGKDKGIEKNPKKRRFNVEDLDFVALELKEAFQGWLDYKRERSESYKSERSVAICYNNLIKLSQGNFSIAIQIIEQSIGNNWAGIFELKNKNNGTNQQNISCYSNGNLGKEERDRIFLNSATEQLRESKGNSNPELPF